MECSAETACLVPAQSWMQVSFRHKRVHGARYLHIATGTGHLKNKTAGAACKQFVEHCTKQAWKGVSLRRFCMFGEACKALHSRASKKKSSRHSKPVVSREREPPRDGHLLQQNEEPQQFESKLHVVLGSVGRSWAASCISGAVDCLHPQRSKPLVAQSWHDRMSPTQLCLQRRSPTY